MNTINANQLPIDQTATTLTYRIEAANDLYDLRIEIDKATGKWTGTWEDFQGFNEDTGDILMDEWPATDEQMKKYAPKMLVS